MEAANPDDAHRPLDKSHNLAASLSHVETRQVRYDYTLRWDGKLYQIEPQAMVSGLRGANVRVEQRLDGSLAVRYRRTVFAGGGVRCQRQAERRAPEASRRRTRRRAAGQRLE